MSFKKGENVFTIIDCKVVKGRVTRAGGTLTSVKVGSKSHKLENTAIFKTEVSALRQQMRNCRSNRASYRKQATVAKREVRTLERAVKTADKKIEKIQARIAKVSS
jgi:chromosome segregation ATPase